MMEEKIKTLLVDDHTIFREGIAALLKQIDGVEIVGMLSSGEEAVSVVDDLNPDLIIMDILMGGMNGIEATRWIKEQNREIKVVIVSSEIKKEWVSLGIQSGIDGYLPKNASREDLLNAITAVKKGEKYFAEAITTLVFEDFYQSEKTGQKPKRKVAEGLTRRENEVLALVAEGKTNQQVADELYVSVKTVETHKTNILEKLGLRNTAELVKYAIKHEIISV